ncbi:MAG: dihydropteroate synthase-like protein [Nitrososphaerota archaeon]|jgi:dihydropteroate synthase-like protein|nr:dihydropteroate synthase-like protein [Nitrososphaerota archaeon]
MKVLLVTGRLAQDIVKNYAQQANIVTEVVALNVPVAAFLNSETIITGLKNHNLHDIDMILTPGLSHGDTHVITKTLGVPVFKGSRYAADLPTVLEAIDKVALSTTIPACDLLRDTLIEKALKEIEAIEQNNAELLKHPSSMLIKNLAIGKNFPMRVMAEIVDAALMSDEEIQFLAKKFASQGANIIDVGMIAGKSNPENAARIVKAVKTVVDLPVSIDTLDPKEIKAAVSAGVDLILSADAGNIDQLAVFATNIPVVIIPTNQCEGHFPKKAQERVQLTEELIVKAKKLGFRNILADLILEPLNVLESFIAFKEFGIRNPDVPLFVGVANVTELFDADSVGINALLAQLSAEIDASIMLATEKSTKAKGTVHEEVVAAKMMYLAKKRASVPKDLGLDLLILKDKRSCEELYDVTLEQKSIITLATDETMTSELDSVGMFKITLDRKNNDIIALLFTDVSMTKPINIIKGKTAKNIYTKIIQLQLVTRLDHAAYLGSELEKAEIALRIGKAYIQDVCLFKKMS